MTTYNRQNFTYDDNLLLKDAGLVAADAAATVSSAEKIVDLGSGLVEGKVVADILAIEIATGDETYQILVQGSNSATFASGIVNLAERTVGAAAALTGSADVAGTACREVIPFVNERGGINYRYVRLYTNVTGTIATGINFMAFIAKED